MDRGHVMPPGGNVVNHKLGQKTSGATRRIYFPLIHQKLSRGYPGESGAKQEVLLRSPCWFGLTTLSALLVLKICC